MICLSWFATFLWRISDFLVLKYLLFWLRAYFVFQKESLKLSYLSLWELASSLQSWKNTLIGKEDLVKITEQNNKVNESNERRKETSKQKSSHLNREETGQNLFHYNMPQMTKKSGQYYDDSSVASFDEYERRHQKESNILSNHNISELHIIRSPSKHSSNLSSKMAATGQNKRPKNYSRNRSIHRSKPFKSAI